MNHGWGKPLTIEDQKIMSRMGLVERLGYMFADRTDADRMAELERKTTGLSGLRCETEKARDLGRQSVITAIFIQDGVMQLVLTPETDYEKSTLKTLGAGSHECQMFNGTFYGCAGGWYRQSRDYGSPYEPREDASLIIRVDKTPPSTGDSGAGR